MPAVIDEDAENGDWTKQTWDLFDDAGLVDSVPRLLALLQRLEMTPAHFMTLPVYRYNVARLQWLRGLAEGTR